MNQDEVITLAESIANVMGKRWPARVDDILSAALYCTVIKDPPEDCRSIKGWWITTIRGYILNELNQRFRLQSVDIKMDLEDLRGSNDNNVYEFIDELDANEKQVVELKAAGYSGKEIAELINVSEPTVSRRLASVRTKAIKFYGRTPC